MLVALRRGDGKTAVLCALFGGVAVAAVAAAPAWSAGPALPTAAVLCGCVLLVGPFEVAGAVTRCRRAGQDAFEVAFDGRH
ncbi:hypothetical protein ACIPYS_09800 [Kitasatospora sp. NPDC089913]|uniref:hypothetical protein n=1 Tax=Kitasatospora sp. NPDC089913 TaxID=3364080 RepID=UPI003823FEEC